MKPSCRRIFIPVLVLAALLLAIVQPVGTLVAKEAGAQGPLIRKMTIDVPVVIEDQAREEIIAQLTALAQEKLVYLDLQISFKRQSNAAQPFSLTIKGIGAPKEQDCAFGPLPMGAGAVYELAPLAGHNHQLISVYSGDRAAFPYHDISCEYRMSGQVAAFHVRGFFHVLTNDIPTAILVQLRPFNPPSEQVQKLFAGP